MRVFQQILTCFLWLFIADIAVREVPRMINQSNFVCSNSTLFLKLSLKNIVNDWEDASSVSKPLNPFRVKQFFAFVLILFLSLFLSKSFFILGFKNQKSTHCITPNHVMSRRSPSLRRCPLRAAQLVLFDRIKI